MIMNARVESKRKIEIHVNCAWIEIRIDDKIVWKREGMDDNWYDEQHRPIADGMIALGSLIRSLTGER